LLIKIDRLNFNRYYVSYSRIYDDKTKLEINKNNLLKLFFLKEFTKLVILYLLFFFNHSKIVKSYRYCGTMSAYLVASGWI